MAVDGWCVEDLVWLIDLPPYPLSVGTTRTSGLDCVGPTSSGCRWPTIDEYLISLGTDSYTYIPMQLEVQTLNISQAFQMGHTASAASILRQLQSLSVSCSDPVPVFARYFLTPLIMAIAAASTDPGYNATSVSIALANAASGSVSFSSPPPPPSSSSSTSTSTTTSSSSSSSSSVPNVIATETTNTTSDAAYRKYSAAGYFYSRLYAPPTAAQPRLRRLVINDCGLTGLLPPYTSWLQLPNLEHLDLSRNLLSGPLPATFGPAPPLTYLNLSRNHITGPLTAAHVRYGGCGRTLDLSHNDLRGGLPSAWLRSACTLYGKTSAGLQPRRMRMRALLERVVRRGLSGEWYSSDVERGPDGGRLEYDPTNAPANMAAKQRQVPSAAFKPADNTQAINEDSSTANMGASTVTTTVGTYTFVSGAYAFWLSYPMSYMYGGDNCPMYGVAWNEPTAAGARNGTGRADGEAFPFTVLLYGNPRLRTPGGDAAGYATAASQSLYFSIQENACTAFQPMADLLWLWGSFGGCALAVLIAVAVQALLNCRTRTNAGRGTTGPAAAAAAAAGAAGAATGNNVPGGAAAGGGGAIQAGVNTSPGGVSRSGSAAVVAAGASPVLPVSTGGRDRAASVRQDGQQQEQGGWLAPGGGLGTEAPQPAGTASGPAPAAEPGAGGAAAAATAAAGSGAATTSRIGSANNPSGLSSSQPGGGSGSGGGGDMAGVIVVAHARAYSLRAAQRLSVFGGVFLDATERVVIWTIFGVPWGPICRTIVAISAHLAAAGLTYVMALPSRVEYCKTVRGCLPYIFVVVPALSAVSIGLTLFLMRATRQLAGVMSKRVAASVTIKVGADRSRVAIRTSNDSGGGAPGSGGGGAVATDLWKLQKELEEEATRHAYFDNSDGSSSQTGRGSGSGSGDGQPGAPWQGVPGSQRTGAGAAGATGEGRDRWVNGQQPPLRSESSGCLPPGPRPGVLLPTPSPSTPSRNPSGSGGLQRRAQSGGDATAPGALAAAAAAVGSPRTPTRVHTASRTFAAGSGAGGYNAAGGSSSREPSPLGHRGSIGPSRLAGSSTDGYRETPGAGAGAGSSEIEAARDSAGAAMGPRPVAEGLEDDSFTWASPPVAPTIASSVAAADGPTSVTSLTPSSLTWSCGASTSSLASNSTITPTATATNLAAGGSTRVRGGGGTGTGGSRFRTTTTTNLVSNAPTRSTGSSEVPSEERVSRVSRLTDGRSARTVLEFRLARVAELAAAPGGSQRLPVLTGFPSLPAAEASSSSGLGPRTESRLEAWTSMDPGAGSASDLVEDPDDRRAPAGGGVMAAAAMAAAAEAARRGLEARRAMARRTVSRPGPVCEGGGLAAAAAESAPVVSAAAVAAAAAAIGPEPPGFGEPMRLDSLGAGPAAAAVLAVSGGGAAPMSPPPEPHRLGSSVGSPAPNAVAGRASAVSPSGGADGAAGGSGGQPLDSVADEPALPGAIDGAGASSVPSAALGYSPSVPQNPHNHHHVGVSPHTLARLLAANRNTSLSGSRQLRAGPRNPQGDAGDEEMVEDVQDAMGQLRLRGSAQLSSNGRREGSTPEGDRGSGNRGSGGSAMMPRTDSPRPRQPSKRVARSLDFSGAVGGGTSSPAAGSRMGSLNGSRLAGDDPVARSAPLPIGSGDAAPTGAGGALGASPSQPSNLGSRRQAGPPPPLALPSAFGMGSGRVAAVGSAPGSPRGGQGSRRHPARAGSTADAGVYGGSMRDPRDSGPSDPVASPAHGSAGGNAWLQDRLNALATMSQTMPSSPATRMPSVAAAAAVAAAASTALTPRRAVASVAAPAATAAGTVGGGGGASIVARAHLERLSSQALLVVNRYLKDATFGRSGKGFWQRLGHTALSFGVILLWSCLGAPLGAAGVVLAVTLVVFHAMTRGCAAIVAYFGSKVRSWRQRGVTVVSPMEPSVAGAAAGPPPPPPPAAAPSEPPPAAAAAGWLSRFDEVASWVRLELGLFLGIHTHVAGWLLYVPLSFFTGTMYGLGYLWGKDAVPDPWVFMACNAACLAGALLLLIELACDLPAWEYGVCRYPYSVAVRTAMRTASNDGQEAQRGIAG